LQLDIKIFCIYNSKMLRRVENISISHKPGFFTGNGLMTMTIGKTVYNVAKIHKSQYQNIWDKQRSVPVGVARVGERTYWLFESKYYWDNENLAADDVYALLVTKQQREKQRVERAKAIVASGVSPQPARRGAIPEDLRQLVWTRDRGKCQKCGSTTELQFDHIIPIALGGATSEANLQILCGPCNRKKGAGLSA